MKYFPLQNIIALHDAMIETMQGLKGIEPSRIVYLESALNLTSVEIPVVKQ